MSAKPPIRNAPGAGASGEVRAPAAKETRRSLSWVREVLTRSIGLQQRRNQLHVVLIEPKRGTGVVPPSDLLLQQRAELGARLLVHDPATQTVRHLFLVHDALDEGGWTAVDAMPRPVLGRALAEAEMMASQEASPLMAGIIATLGEMVATADRQAERAALVQAERALLRRDWEKPAVPEVSEASHEEYELMERSWIGTVPSGLDLREPRLPNPG